jgi:GH24 family phage-related lysozyme (muramidase)
MEGAVPFLYLDVKGLVTTAIGNLVDPLPAALGLPLVRPDGSKATQSEIAAEWANVKGRTDLKLRGGMAFKSVTRLRLTEEGVQQVVARKLTQMDAYLARRFRCTEHDDCRAQVELGSECTAFGYASWPADAQLGVLSMAWACGPAFDFPHLERALREGDFLAAAAECFMNEAGNPGLRPRNRANRVLFRNAAFALGAKLDPDLLFYPRDLSGEADTLPSLQAPPPPSSEPTRIVDWSVVHPAVPMGRPGDDEGGGA